MHKFEVQQFLPTAIETAWAFFSSPHNLSRITPPEMSFKVLSKSLDEEIYTGMLIDYSVKPLLGIPMHWQTEITGVQKPTQFTDRQLKGPYTLWEHTHTFTALPNGVLMTDHVQYIIPLGVLGKWLNTIVVKGKINRIFEYRKQALEKIFS